MRATPLGMRLFKRPAAASSAGTWAPSDLGSKLQAWQKGDALAGSNGSNVTSWTDSSGNSNTATGGTNKPTLVTSGLNGMNTVSFATNQDFVYPTTLLSGATSAAGFAVYKINNSPPSSGQGGALFGDFGQGAGSDHTPWEDGNFYIDFGSTTRQTVTGVTGSTSFRIIGFRSQASDWRMELNGSNAFTTGTNTFSLPNVPGFPGRLGFSASGEYLNGQVAEVVICSDFLTTLEKEKVEGYLAWKWGLVSSLPGGHTYKSAAP